MQSRPMRAGILDVVETNKKLWKEKSSVPGPGPSATVGKALLSPQRHTQVLDVNPFANTAFSDVQTAVLAEFGQAKKNDAKCFADLNVTLDRQFIPQWHSKYFSLIMPFEIPRMFLGRIIQGGQSGEGARERACDTYDVHAWFVSTNRASDSELMDVCSDCPLCVVQASH